MSTNIENPDVLAEFRLQIPLMAAAFRPLCFMGVKHL
jgi:hypothetical protein